MHLKQFLDCVRGLGKKPKTKVRSWLLKSVDWNFCDKYKTCPIKAVVYKQTNKCITSMEASKGIGRKLINLNKNVQAKIVQAADGKDNVRCGDVKNLRKALFEAVGLKYTPVKLKCKK